MKILADSTLPNITAYFQTNFELTLFNNQQEAKDQIANHDLLICRSTLAVDAALLKNSHIQYVATASSGTSHIDIDYLTRQNIRLFDAKGCNADAVADYVLTILTCLQQHQLPKGKQVGIIGLGYVGTAVASRLEKLGYKLNCYDPFKEKVDKQREYCKLNDITQCDLICLHPNLHDTEPHPSKHLVNAQFLDQLKTGTVLINAARGDVVDEQALLTCPQKLYYCADVYQNEPDINPQIIEKAMLCTPHIAGHSIEGKQNAIRYLSKKIHDYFDKSEPDIKTTVTSYPLDQTKTRAEQILSIYNPDEDTRALKKAVDKEACFQALRKAHNTRHDFSCYTWNHDL